MDKELLNFYHSLYDSYVKLMTGLGKKNAIKKYRDWKKEVENTKIN